MRFVMPRVARRFSGGTRSWLAGSVFVLLLTGAAVASGHYPDRAQNRMEGDRGFIDTKAVQQFLDQHGTWRGSDYFVYCPAFTGAYIQARGPLTITADYFPSSFTLPLTELEQMNGGRTFTVRYNVMFKYMRTSDKPRIWSSWMSGGGTTVDVTLHSTPTKHAIITNVSDPGNPTIGQLCNDFRKPTTIPEL